MQPLINPTNEESQIMKSAPEGTRVYGLVDPENNKHVFVVCDDFGYAIYGSAQDMQDDHFASDEELDDE